MIAGISDQSKGGGAGGDETPKSNQPFCKKTDGKPPSLDAFDCSVFKSIKEKFYDRVNKVIESNDIRALSDIYALPLRLVFHDAGEVVSELDQRYQL